ncbi:uncharacterized protein [Fopius arisanus]|uniref:At2g44570 protein n=1 Tax=Fopius arisanus TaxID=64838 RepID=A0A0C9RLK7_9HYME|nr:PREDICTED: uncharacterized protein LOC105268553 [Fopius arisanus]
MLKMSLRQFIIILSIFTWCAYIDAGRQVRPLDCEKYVFHPHCRGTQARKRMISQIKNENTEQPCTCGGGKDDHANAIPNAKLLEAILANGFDVNTIYNAYAATSDRHRDYHDNSRDRGNQRRRSMIDNSVDVPNTDLEVDY